MTVGILILRGRRLLCDSGLMDLTVLRCTPGSLPTISIPLTRERLIVMVFCFLADVRLTRAALLDEAWKTSLLRGDIRMFVAR